ncbi:MAG: FAD-binding oxidoreductase, partial [Arenicellales bacterium]
MNHSNFLSALTNILGERYVLSDKTQTASYLIEQRGLFESACLAVVKPASTEEVRACVKLCDEHDISIVPMGGNTGLCGGAVATEQQIILSLERLNKILDIDTENYSMTVQAGCILANIQNVASEQDRLFPLSLGAEGSCQIGGNLSTNAGGINVLHYGNARDLCLGIEAVLPNGTVFSDLSSLRKDNTGYGFKQLLIGAEGSLGIITAATLKLFPQPKEAVTALVALEKIESVISLYNLIREASSDRITTFELIPSIAIEFTAKHFDEHPNPFDTAHPWHVLVVVHSANPEDNLSELFSGALETAFEKELISDALIAQNLSQAEHF